MSASGHRSSAKRSGPLTKKEREQRLQNRKKQNALNRKTREAAVESSMNIRPLRLD